MFMVAPSHLFQSYVTQMTGWLMQQGVIASRIDSNMQAVLLYREADTRGRTLRERAKAIQASSERAELAEAKECLEAAGVHASQRGA